MTITPQPSGTLLGILAGLNSKRPKRFLMETFFPKEITFDTEEVYFEKLQGTRRLAPFVSPLVKGKAMPRGGDSIASFKPPYLKPKHALSASQNMVRKAGESIEVPLDPAARVARNRAEILLEQDDAVVRREEWMASSILRTGALTVQAEEHPTMVISLGRPAGHTVQLTSTARWGESGVSTYANIKTWAQTVADASGIAPTTVIMDPKAAALFLADPAVIAMFNTANYRPPSTLNLLGVLAIPDEVQPLGSFGQFNFFQYQSTYWDTDGTVRKYMPDYTVIMASPTGSEGVRCYGAIQDHRAGLVATSRFPKEWIEEDPSVLWLMTQSAPLPLLGLPESTFCATVR